MTPEGVIALAQKRLGNTHTSIDWDSIYGIVIDDIFNASTSWKFARDSFNFIQSQSLAEKVFNSTATELLLHHITNIKFTTSFTLVGGVPIPTTNSVYPLDFKPSQEFEEDFPDDQMDGTVEWWTEVKANDGKNGMAIKFYRRPTADAAMWVTGYFKPLAVVDNNEIPILPVQFHSMLIDGVVGYAGEETGKDSLSSKNFTRFEKKLKKLVLWDSYNPSYKMRIGGRGGNGKLKLYLPGDFPLGVGK